MIDFVNILLEVTKVEVVDFEILVVVHVVDVTPLSI